MQPMGSSSGQAPSTALEIDYTHWRILLVFQVLLSSPSLFSTPAWPLTVSQVRAVGHATVHTPEVHKPEAAR